MLTGRFAFELSGSFSAYPIMRDLTVERAVLSMQVNSVVTLSFLVHEPVPDGVLHVGLNNQRRYFQIFYIQLSIFTLNPF